MSGTADIARWLALALGIVAGLLIAYFVVRRLLEAVLVRRVARQVARVESVIVGHRRENFRRLDRLLFQLGEIADVDAIESVLDKELEAGGDVERDRLTKLYDALGITERYLAQLRDSPRWTERTRAAHALGRLGVARAVPALVEALRDPHEDARSVKLAVAQALGRMQAEAAVPLLIDELETVNEWASPRLADVLTSIGSTALPMLLEALGDGSRNNARVWAAQILGRIGDTRAVPAMLRHLRDRREQVRMSVAEALGRLSDRRAINDLVRVALHDPVGPVRAEAARALGLIGDPRVMESLVELLADADYWTRLRAIEAIEAVRPEDVSFLEAALRDPSEEVRKRAAVALERLGVLERCIDELSSADRDRLARARESLVAMGRAGLIDSIVSYLEHPDFRVRARVAQALGEVGERRALSALTPLLEDVEWPVRARAVEAIGRLRPLEGVRLLLPALADAEETVRTSAVEAIQRLGPPEDGRDLKRLLDLFDTANAAIRTTVLKAVAHLDDARVRRLLEGALGDPFPGVRLEATEALAARADERWIEPLVERLSDADERIRAAAARALGRIGTPDALGFLARHLDTPDRQFREALTSSLAAHGMDLLSQVAESSEPTLERTLALVWSLGKVAAVDAVRRLRRLAEHLDYPVRAAVAGALGKHAERPEATEILIRLLGDRNERVRAAAVNALARTADRRPVPRLLEALDDPDAFVRNRVVLALGMLGGEEALAGLERAADRARGPDAVTYVIIGYALHGEEGALEAALRLLDQMAGIQERVEAALSREPEPVRLRFQQTLHLGFGQGADETPALSQEGLVEHYVHVLRNHQQAEARAAAVRALQALNVGAHRVLLMDTVRTDPEPEVRRLALHALTDLGEPDVRMAGLFVESLRDPSAGVQTEAARALAVVADARYNETLLTCLKSGHAELARAAVDALVAANRAHLESFIDTLMGHTDLPILRGGARVLGVIADPRATGLLRAWLSSREPELRAAATAALGRIGTVEGKEAVITSLSDPAEPVRLAAIEALAQRHGVDVMDVVTPLSADPSVAVRIALARLIGRIRDPAAVELGAALSRDPQERVRLEALISLLLLGDVGATQRFVELVTDQPREVREGLRSLQSEHPAVTRARELITSSRRVEGRVAGLRALRALEQDHLDLLLEVLADPDAEVRVAAVEGLGTVDDPRAAEALNGLLMDPDPRVRDAVRKLRLKLVDES